MMGGFSMLRGFGLQYWRNIWRIVSHKMANSKLSTVSLLPCFISSKDVSKRWRALVDESKISGLWPNFPAVALVLASISIVDNVDECLVMRYAAAVEEHIHITQLVALFYLDLWPNLEHPSYAQFS